MTTLNAASIKALADAIAAQPRVISATPWTSVPGKERIYVDLVKCNGGKSWNGGRGHTIVVDLATGTCAYDRRAGWAGAATRKWHTEENDTLAEVRATVDAHLNPAPVEEPVAEVEEQVAEATAEAAPAAAAEGSQQVERQDASIVRASVMRNAWAEVRRIRAAGATPLRQALSQAMKRAWAEIKGAAVAVVEAVQEVAEAVVFGRNRDAKRNGRGAYRLACALEDALPAGAWQDRRGRTASALAQHLAEADMEEAMGLIRSGRPVLITV